MAPANQARLTAPAVVDELPVGAMRNGMALTMDILQRALVEDEERRLRTPLRTADAGDETEVKVAVGTPFLEVIREVLRDGCALVLISVETSGMVGRLFGSDNIHLLRKCPCSVWLCKPNAGRPYGRSIIPTRE